LTAPPLPPFVRDPFRPVRRATREVMVGDVGVGGSNPIRVQSMTTTDSMDTKATASQCEALVDAGCEIVRITAPSLREAANLEAIAVELRRRGVRIPLVADIHYTPNAALVAAEHVEKVRINPGNYADKKKFEVREYDDAQWSEEVERVAECFRPLVRRCRELGRSLRIGTNHGSLADRILNRFGDTPRGMVESALEFLDVCEAEGFRDLVFSMKSSNTQVAIQAYRMLAARLEARAPGEPSYPFHVGVTEAGDGDDGRIKSAIGIGSLLTDGIGDTIRVSLTEHPVREVPVAAALVRTCAVPFRVAPAAEGPLFEGRFVDDPYAHMRRTTRSGGAEGFEFGADHPVRVEIELGPVPGDSKQAARDLAESLAAASDVECEGLTVDVLDPHGATLLRPLAEALREVECPLPISARVEASFAPPCAQDVSRLVIGVGALIEDEGLHEAAAAAVRTGTTVEWSLRGRPQEIASLLDRALRVSADENLEDILVSVDSDQPVHSARVAVAALRERRSADVPIVLRHWRDGERSEEEALLAAAVAFGAPLCDGIGDAVALAGFGDPGRALSTAYRILQGARLRTSWTEYISCPSCGRTLFDLEEITARIKRRTEHLRGVKIAVMGCIVNGPGEMADADFGYVGSGPGIVNLYVGKELVVRKVPEAEADSRLVELIREHGRWSDSIQPR